MSSSYVTARSVLAVPLLIALATLVGLVAALIGDGAWDSLSWLALSVPPLILVRHLARRR